MTKREYRLEKLRLSDEGVSLWLAAKDEEGWLIHSFSELPESYNHFTNGYVAFLSRARAEQREED